MSLGHVKTHSEYSGVISKFIAQVKQNKPITIFGDGEQTRDFVFVSDVVSANILAMESDVQGVFNVGCGVQTSLNELANKVKDIVGIDVSVIYEPSRTEILKRHLQTFPWPRKMLGHDRNILKEGLGARYPIRKSINVYFTIISNQVIHFSKIMLNKILFGCLFNLIEQ